MVDIPPNHYNTSRYNRCGRLSGNLPIIITISLEERPYIMEYIQKPLMGFWCILMVGQPHLVRPPVSNPCQFTSRW